MPKPLLKPSQTETQGGSMLSLTQNSASAKVSTQEDKMKLDRLLRKQRSESYMNAIRHLDAGGHTCNSQLAKEILDAIRDEFPEVELPDLLIGIVSKCYLGENYEVHTLDINGNIIEHFRQGQKLKCGLEKARSIAIHGGYEFIEVYIDCLRAVSSNGSVSVIR
ncbi:hypothetical protein [Acetivibrio straminisolvens]|jgi:hypothetical protein|uniref:Uncharacterized protein n=1 Tax=Acetivibrio straminisolvens JCM 21531 TaxID=1294263 RepID=W4V337_9FIRM|nr:hypothetical protein [Acetivibrio straminisolvens]GAE87870.1 hypothetical protein JCM21531_1274 [Acetivibrio straminisolvens JCM 21531]